MSEPYTYPVTDMLKAGLEQLGYKHETVILNGRFFTKYTSPANKVWFTSNAHLTYPFISGTAKEVSKDKRLAYDLATSLGIRIPFTKIITSEMEIDAGLWQELAPYVPLIAKPAVGSLSNGLTLDIRDVNSLRTAISEARTFSPNVLVQQQIKAQEIRFLILNGEFKAAITRQASRLIGNGIDIIETLLRTENAERTKLDFEYLSYPQLQEPLIDLSGIDMTRVLQEGEILELGKSSMIRRGASAYNLTEKVHSSYIETAITLADALGKGLIAVDMLIEDYQAPKSDSNYAFLEFNMAPNLIVCYSVRNGQHYDILKDLIPMIDEAINGREGSKS